MRNIVITSLLLGALATASSAQRKRASYVPMYPLELGVQVGTCHFLGDLGGQSGKGTPFLRDTDIKLLRPALGVFARYNFGGNFALRLDANFLQVAGDDKLTNSNDGQPFSPEIRGGGHGWFRFYRNMNFRSRIFEASLSGEIVPYNFELGGGYQGYSVLAPYGCIGIGIFNFKPQTLYDGQWIDLKPLSTEGQGLVSGRSPYALTQINIPMGFGLKWIYNDTWSLGLEVNHRITFTDYIDDVSTTYVDPQIFYDNFSLDKADLAAAIARRSDEIDPGSVNGKVTKPGEQRGDPKDNDSYYSITIRFSYFLDPGNMGGSRRYGCPVW